MIKGMPLSQTEVEVVPERGFSVANNSTKWAVYVDNEREYLNEVKKKSRDKAKAMASEQNAMYRCYRIEPGVPVGKSVSKEIDYSERE